MDLSSTPAQAASSRPQSTNATTRTRAGGEPVLGLEDVRKEFATETAVQEVSFTVNQGELLTLLGPSGCGKTTTLRMIAGLERPSEGQVIIDDTAVAGTNTFVPPEQRNVGIVFQDYALFPHMCAEDNVGFGIDHWDDDRRRQRIEELFDLVGLTEQRDCYPEELSGGQKQRVALARALAPNPEVLLLDEPFSNLDRDLRVQMREEVRRILKEADVTGIFVTHDQEEALSISDRIAVMHNGRIEQIGHPESVFQDPNSRFVAEFLGDAGFIPGTVNGDTVETTLGPIDREQIQGLDVAYDGTDIDVLARPDDLTAFPASKAEADGRVVYRKYLGPMVQYRVELHDGTTVECMHNHTESVELDDPVIVRLTADHGLSWFPHEETGPENC